MQGLQAAYGLDGDDLWQVAVGFGGGIGGMQDACGALTGAVMAIGQIAARRRGSDRNDRAGLRQDTASTTKELYRRFQSEFGEVDCRTLTGYDFNAPGGREAFHQDPDGRARCRRFVAFAVQALAELEQANDSGA